MDQPIRIRAMVVEDSETQAFKMLLLRKEKGGAVYGMPAAADALGAACETLPLDAIAPRLLELAAVQEAN